MKGFAVAGGSVPGTDHTIPGKPGWKNNQDAYAWHSSDGCLVAVICDGCGHGEHSEVGAQIGARIAVKSFGRMFGVLKTHNWLNDPAPLNACQVVETDVTNQIADIATTISGGHRGERRFAETIRDYFLFTMMVAIVTPRAVFVFSSGDGVYAVNGETTVIPPYEKNEPPYLAYRLVPSSVDQSLLGFQSRMNWPVWDVRSLVLGSDGVSHLIGAADQKLPGKDELIGPFSQFWTEDRFVKNPDSIRRRLALINLETIDRSGEVPRIKHGPLPDDTTIVVIRPMEESTDA